MLLAIDSATAACSAALIRGSELVDARFETVGRGHAERLVPMIQDLLEGRRPSAIVVDCGPGSFTGVRVGLAAAHGMAIGWGIPLSGYSSMAAVAAAAEEGDADEVAVALTGGHGELFVQSWHRDPLAPLSDLHSLRPEEAASAVSAPLVLGSAAELLVGVRGSGAWRDALPRAADARLLPETLRSLAPRPIYGRAPDAKPMAS